MKAGVTSCHALWLTFTACLLSAGAFTDGPAYSEAYPRALAAADSQRLAAVIERNVAPLTPALHALGGPYGAIAFERLLGGTFLALDAYASADDHLRRAYALALLADAKDDAAASAMSAARSPSDRPSRSRRAPVERPGATGDARRPAMGAGQGRGIPGRRRPPPRPPRRRASARTARLALQRALGQEAGTATALSNLGTLARDRGDYATALDLFRQSLAIRERNDDQLELTLRNLALIYRDLGDDAAARNYFTRALDVARHHGDSANYAATLGTWAGYLVDAGEFAPALAAADESLAVSGAIGDRPSVGFDC